MSIHSTAKRSKAKLRTRWMRSDSPVVYAGGRLAVWTVRRILIHRGPAALFLVVLASLLALGLIPALDPYGKLAWLLAGLLLLAAAMVLVAGFAEFLVEESRQAAGSGRVGSATATRNRGASRLVWR